jgi:hypothetical protein
MALRLFGDGRIEPIVEITADSPTDVPLTLIGAEDQTANLLEIKDSDDNILINVDSNGQIKIDGEPLSTNDQVVFFQRMFA